jgi:signal peptidase II
MDRIPPNRYLIFSLIAALGCAADLATKTYMFSWPELRAGQTFWLWQSHVGFQLSLNEGALFGMGQGMVWMFAALSLLAAVAIPTWLFWYGAARDLWLTIALGGVMAGVLGNLYDRLGLPGEVWPGGARAGQRVYAVRDWILWQASDQWRWPNFNLADSLLVVGAAVLLLRAITQPASSAADQTERRD